MKWLWSKVILSARRPSADDTGGEGGQRDSAGSRSSLSHLLRPLGNEPFRADDAVRVQDSFDDPTLDDIRPDYSLADGIRVLAPGSLSHRLPRVARIRNGDTG